MYPKSGFIKDGDGDYWLVLKDNDALHINECAVNIFGGNILHMSKLPEPLIEVYLSEIMS